jgi:hypothetical protein
MGPYHAQRLLPTDSLMSHINKQAMDWQFTTSGTEGRLTFHTTQLGTPSPFDLLGSEGASNEAGSSPPPICLYDTTAHLRFTPLCLHDNAAPLRYSISSQRHHCTFAVHPLVPPTPPRIRGSLSSFPRHRRALTIHLFRLHDIAAHLRLTHFVSTTICGPSIVSTTSLRPCSPPICLTDIAAHLRLTHFVSTTSPHPCDTLFRLYDHLHPLCLTDIAVHLRFTHCLTDTAHLRFILFGLYDFTPHHSTSTFYLSGISRTRGSVRLFVIALACPKVVRLYRTYLRIRTVV